MGIFWDSNNIYTVYTFAFEHRWKCLQAKQTKMNKRVYREKKDQTQSLKPNIDYLLLAAFTEAPKGTR